MKILKNVGLVLGITLSVFFVSFIVLAWNPPSAAPTGGNVAEPINVGSGAQTKSGNLTINGNVGVGSLNSNFGLNVASGNCPARFRVGSGPYVYLGCSNYGVYSVGTKNYFSGNIGIGTISPTQKLDVNGNARIRGHIYDSSNNVIYNNSTKKIPRERLPFSEGDIVSTAGGAYNIANLSPSNVKSGVRYGVNKTGALSCPRCNSCCPTCPDTSAYTAIPVCPTWVKFSYGIGYCGFQQDALGNWSWKCDGTTLENGDLVSYIVPICSMRMDKPGGAGGIAWVRAGAHRMVSGNSTSITFCWGSSSGPAYTIQGSGYAFFAFRQPPNESTVSMRVCRYVE